MKDKFLWIWNNFYCFTKHKRLQRPVLKAFPTHMYKINLKLNLKWMKILFSPNKIHLFKTIFSGFFNSCTEELLAMWFKTPTFPEKKTLDAASTLEWDRYEDKLYQELVCICMVEIRVSTFNYGRMCSFQTLKVKTILKGDAPTSLVTTGLLKREASPIYWF